MKGKLITDFSKLKIGDKITNYNNIYTFINITDNGDTVNVLRKDGKTDMFSNKNWYHHIEDKPSIIDYVGKWCYTASSGDVAQINIRYNMLDISDDDFKCDEVIKAIESGAIIIRDTLEEIKQVYREYNK